VTNNNILLLEERVTPNTNLAGLAQSTLAFDKDDFAHWRQIDQIPPILFKCIVDANKNRDFSIVDIPNAFVQTIVEDEKDKALIRICGPLAEILVSIAPNVYGPFVTVGKKGHEEIILVL
jgi:hypothetical protein